MQDQDDGHDEANSHNHTFLHSMHSDFDDDEKHRSILNFGHSKLHKKRTLHKNRSKDIKKREKKSSNYNN